MERKVRSCIGISSRVVLYGSRARGDALPDSDYDMTVFLSGLDGPSDLWTEADKIAMAATNILNETGAVIHTMPYRGWCLS